VAHVPPNRVFLPDVRGGDQYLRATWHAESGTIVFSHWNGEVCMASTPVALTECAPLIDLQVRSLCQMGLRQGGPTGPSQRPGTLGRLRSFFRPKLADVVDLTQSFLAGTRHGGRQSGAH
jgi:hypothetical protein